MRFRPCIDLHNGAVKQIVGSTLTDQKSSLKENFVSDRTADFFARKFAGDGLFGGHVILLDPKEKKTRDAALSALAAFPGGLQVGGGITADNAQDYLDAGASHVIATSAIFRNGALSVPDLSELRQSIGSQHLVLDLSCKKEADGSYRIMTDRWQTRTNEILTLQLLDRLSDQCAEFLIHAIDVEGKKDGFDEALITLLAGHKRNRITYAGGIRSMEDLARIRRIGGGRIDVTIGSALSLYGGPLLYEDVVSFCGTEVV